MAFNSVIFAAFLAVFLLLYYSIPKKLQLYWVLLAGCIFYAYVVPYYLVLVFITILVDYYVVKNITAGPGRKKSFLYISLFVNLSILFAFKYLDFTITNVNGLAKLAGWNYSIGLLKLALPVGLSFYIFKSLSYVIDVYRGNSKHDENLNEYASYVLFFPEILSGPIDRGKNLLPQLKVQHSFEMDGFKYGLKLFAWGLFKKAVIADRLALQVNHVYGSLHSYHGAELLITVLFYSFQIYCDFSGYSDMAIGCGKMMGFNLQNNFNMPYLARSVADFWRRWHITLSSWFRDYVFLPLLYSSFRKFRGKRAAGIKDETAAYAFAIIITMFLVGLWHGAGRTYIVWGVYLGALLILSQMTKDIRARVRKAFGLSSNGAVTKIIQIAITFSLISISWVFFRSGSLHDSVYVLSNMFIGLTAGISENAFGVYGIQTIISFVLIAFMFTIESFLNLDENPVDLISRRPQALRWVFYYSIFLMILCFGEFGARKFVYFQF